MTVFITEDESRFMLVQQVLTASAQTAAIIHLHSHTFRLTGPLEQAPVEQLMQVWQKTLTAFSPQQQKTSHSLLHSVQSDNLPALYRKPKALVEKTCRYIQQHLEQPLTLSSISKAMNTNRNSLSKAFKTELNMGVSAWLRLQRMQKARQLLLDTNLSIQEISARMGYPLQANFSTSFKNLFKQSPKQIRQELLDEQK
ncbi:AraC family transcriptional regulator [Rheinheimera sp. F8]|uniref:helix-turn-helix transcriptional regulator n=1 Tax=Rheinheimera sp. F8 TaxID=1763998 RepID=UPI000A9F0D3F|nr:AraC family transcriptional regulator [Rheinheimera sp. F8]